MKVSFELAPEVSESQRMFLGGVARDEAIELWRRSSCEEFTGGRHSFMLTVEYGQAEVRCEVCRYDPLALGDLQELMFFGPVPVDVQVETIVHPGGPWGGEEYDVEVEVTPR